jgi:hypothetical protein
VTDARCAGLQAMLQDWFPSPKIVKGCILRQRIVPIHTVRILLERLTYAWTSLVSRMPAAKTIEVLSQPWILLPWSLLLAACHDKRESRLR